MACGFFVCLDGLVCVNYNVDFFSRYGEIQGVWPVWLEIAAIGGGFFNACSGV